MDYEIIIARGALRDLDHIRSYVARDNPEAAKRFCQRLLDKAETLGQSPYQGTAIEDRPGARFLVVKSYLMVYRIIEETHTVRVLRYWHGARDRVHMSIKE